MTGPQWQMGRELSWQEGSCEAGEAYCRAAIRSLASRTILAISRRSLRRLTVHSWQQEVSPSGRLRSGLKADMGRLREHW